MSLDSYVFLYPIDAESQIIVVYIIFIIYSFADTNIQAGGIIIILSEVIIFSSIRSWR